MILRGKDAATQQLLECETIEGKIVRLQPAQGSPPGDSIGGHDVYLAPGLIDIQINGFGGTDLESETVTPSDVLKVTTAQWPYGVTQYLPTITPGATERICRGLRAIADAVEQFPEARAAIPGIHLEGPYFNPEDGPRGAHPLRYICKPNWAEFERFQDAARGMIVMVTLAPEIEGAIPFIERLAAAGIIPAIGHHDAKEADIENAVRAGARISTHLGNGSHHILPRHENYIQIQMARDELLASMVVDGHHLPPYFVKNMVRAKGLTRCILTTDAMSAAGAPPGRYPMGLVETEVGADRRVCCPGTPYLAGSAETLDRCISNVVRWAGISLADGLTMATSRPAELLRLKSHGLAVGSVANLVLFRWNGGMQVTHTVVQGNVVFAQ